MITLKNIIEVLEETDITTKFYYNKKTNEILYGENIDKEKIGENIIPMFDVSDKDDYIIMKDYIDTFNDSKIKEELYSKIKIYNQNAIHDFVFILNKNNLLNGWYKYRTNRIKQIAIDWCNKNHIIFEDK